MKYQKKNLEMEIFDEITEEGYSEAPKKDYDRLLKHLFSGIKRTSDMEVLDVGCGTGGNSIRLSKLNLKVKGVDISLKAVEQAQKRAQQLGLDGIEFSICDIENLCYDDHSFDICFCGAVLHHFPDLNKVARELYRVTKMDGRVMAYDPNALHPYVFFVHNVLNRAVHLKGFSPNERALEPKELYSAFKNTGFSNFRFDSIVIYSKKARWSLIRDISYKTVNKIFSGLRGGNMITMTCEKRR